MSRARDFASSFLLSEPTNFLHSVDLDGGKATFLKTNRKLLGEASFVDGRSQIATGQPELLRLDELLDTPAANKSPDRYMFNISFCGSTLLSRLIDVPGRSLVLKEPKCLTDLAAWKTLGIRAGRSTAALAPALRFARNMLRRPFARGEAVTVKPACWVNGMLGEFVEQAERLFPLFVVIDRPGFLRAVLRGGRSRMQHTAQLAWHMASDIPEGEALLAEAVASVADEAGRSANLAMVAHQLQVDRFKHVMEQGGWTAENVVDFNLIANEPFRAAAKACRALELGLHYEERELSTAHYSSRNAKQLEASFSVRELKGADEAVVARHGKLFDASLAWAEARFGPETNLAHPQDKAA